MQTARGSKLFEVADELHRHTTRRNTRQHQYRARRVGEQRNSSGERDGVDAIEGDLDIGDLGSEVSSEQRRSTGCRLVTNAFGGRPQLPGEVAADRGLQFGVPLVADFHREAHHGGRARAGRCREAGDSPEGNDLGAGEDGVGDPSFRRREAFGVFA